MNWRNPFRRSGSAMSTGEFPLDAPLVWLSPVDAWTVRDSHAGCQILGSVGSGKTSGSGATIAKSMLEAGFGGLVLCAKVDEYETWRRYCEQTGRLDSLIRFAPDEKYRFNFLDYELNRVGRGGGLTENLVNLFVTCAKVGDSKSSQQGGGGGSTEFFDKALKQLLRSIIDLLVIANPRGDAEIDLRDMYALVTSTPRFNKKPAKEDWYGDSFWHHCIAAAEAKMAAGSLPESQARDLDTTLLYWSSEFVTLDPETRSNIVITFSSLADMFLRGVLADLFCADTNIFPELCEEGMVIVLDLPVHEFKQLGLVSQVLFKYIWQQTLQRRQVDRFTRPCFLWVDESQLFVNEHDQTFLTTSRSARVSTVMLTQNISNYHVAFGGGIQGKSTADALLALLSTKIFHASNDPVTNEWASDLIGKKWVIKKGMGANINPDGIRTGSVSANEQFEYEVTPRDFTVMKSGGELNNLEVEAIAAQSGRIWKSSDAPYLRVTFRQ